MIEIPIWVIVTCVAVLWLVIGFIFLRIADVGDALVMIDASGYHKTALLMLVCAVILWPINRIIIIVIAALVEKYD